MPQRHTELVCGVEQDAADRHSEVNMLMRVEVARVLANQMKATSCRETPSASAATSCSGATL